jgi:hypothetical protein
MVQASVSEIEAGFLAACWRTIADKRDKEDKSDPIWGGGRIGASNYGDSGFARMTDVVDGRDS